jgi:ABC-type polysaccharide/polyol phosphate transport system ATPase subunit
MNPIEIDLRQAGITFTVHVGGRPSFKGALETLLVGGRRRNVVRVEALRDVTLHIGRGERVGLLGLNGAGKTTLLKVLAGIYPPTSGAARIQGHVCPLFEFATGFEMDYSGWDNIRIRAMLMGMRPEEVEGRLQEIADFSELGDFLNLPVRTYSAGMFVRLAFAVSTAINPEILLLDEIMGAGDIRFAEKARRRMLQFIEQGKLFVFASHSLDLVRALCTRVLWLEGGRVRMDGPANDVIQAYSAGGCPAAAPEPLVSSPTG